MGSTGMVRRIDYLGRVVIPADVRKVLGIRPGDELEVGVDGDRVTLRRTDPGCSLCAGLTDLVAIHGKHVCGACRTALATQGGAAPDTEGPATAQRPDESRTATS